MEKLFFCFGLIWICAGIASLATTAFSATSMRKEISSTWNGSDAPSQLLVKRAVLVFVTAVLLAPAIYPIAGIACGFASIVFGSLAFA